MVKLTLIILACTINSSNPDKFSNGCKEYTEILNEELQELSTPFTCMMRSPIYVAQFMSKHPGYAPKKWSCRYKREEKSI